MLKFELELKMASSMWTARYCFAMKSIPLDTVDVLKAQVRDQQEELQQLRLKMGNSKLAYLNLETKEKTSANAKFVWNTCADCPATENFVVTGDSIRFLREGVYFVALTANFVGACTACYICHLYKDGVSVRYCGGYGSGSYPLVHVMHMDCDQELYVLNSSYVAEVGCTLSITLLK
uniref:TNF family profile domain-containing protein n=1 Tax=Globisporangium ultimum (strain ATCC 200006 / CBS 805.95 / DAOM BR144) TaxID=431595 RepID=K3X5C7_GLOUD